MADATFTEEDLDQSSNPVQELRRQLRQVESETALIKEELNVARRDVERAKDKVAFAALDAAAILNSVDVGLVLLDSALRISRFSFRASELFGLLPTDLGRPFSDLLPRFKDRTLLEECRQVLETGQPAEKEVWIDAPMDVASEREAFLPGSVHGPSPQCYLRRLRPCQLSEIEVGLAITLVDITAHIQAEVEMRRLVTSIRESSDAMLIFDTAGRITAWNRDAEEMYGYLESEALGMQVRDIIPPSFRAACMDRFQSLFGSDRIESFETQRLTKTGRILDIWLNGTWMTDHFGTRVAVATAERDITDRKRHVQTLKSLANVLEDQVAIRTDELLKNEGRLRMIINSVADGIVTIGQNGAIGAFNRAAERMFGYSASEIVGQNVKLLLAPAHFHDEDLFAFLRTGVSRLHGNTMEVTGRQKDGSSLAIELTVGESFDRQGASMRPEVLGPVSTVLIRDITERKELRRQVLEVAEQEQRRIGQDLHDGTQQELYGLGMIAESLYEAMETEHSPQAASARRVSDGLGRAADNVRRLARGLVPAEIDAHGLRVALSELALQATESGGVACRFECDYATEILDSFTATHVYRITQEAVTNALKHAAAKHILISLETDAGQLTLTISDDGSGLADQAQVEGIGLKVMSYRAGMVGGSLRIQAAEGGGTEVVCTVPLE